MRKFCESSVKEEECVWDFRSTVQVDWDPIPSPTTLEYEDSWAEFLPSLESAVKFLMLSSGQSFAAYFEK